MPLPTKTATGGNRFVQRYIPNVPALKRPDIVKTKTIHGEIFYVGIDKKLYIPEAFDKMFKPAVSNTKVKAKFIRDDIKKTRIKNLLSVED